MSGSKPTSWISSDKKKGIPLARSFLRSDKEWEICSHIHHNPPLCLARSNIVKTHGSVVSDTSQYAGLRLVEFDLGNGLERVGELKVGESAGFGRVPDLDRVGGGCEDVVCSMMVDGTRESSLRN